MNCINMVNETMISNASNVSIPTGQNKEVVLGTGVIANISSTIVIKRQ